MITYQKLHPGDLVFTYQYHKSFEERIFSQRGYDLHQFMCLDETVFYDAASQKIFTYNQVSLGAHAILPPS